MRRLARAMVLFGMAGAAGDLRAATFLWDGGHPSQSRWSLNQNWQPNDAPSNDGTADLVLSGIEKLDADSVGDWSINSLTFNNLAGAFVIVGGELTLQGNAITFALANDDTQTQTITNALATAGAQTWSATAGGLLLGGAITNDHALTLTGAFDTTLGGIVAGTGSLTKTGGGTLTLAGANTYTGGTTVSAGTLRGTTTSLQGDIANAAALVFDQTSTGTYSGVISGTGGVTRSGSGVVTFSGANTYTGATTIASGTLRLAGGSALADTSEVVLADVAGAVLDLSGITETIGALSGGGATGGGVTLGTGGALSVGAANTSTTYAGAISGAGSLTKIGSGTLTLAGANTHTGGTTVSAGTLRGTTTSLQGDIANAAALVFDQTGAGTYTGVISGTGGVTRSGSGVVTFSGANTYTGATTIASGTLRLAGGSALADTSQVVLADVAGAVLDLNGTTEIIGALSGGGATGGGVTLGTGGALSVGAANTSTTYAGAISGAGSLTKIGSGTLTLAGANTHTGGTTVSAGTLRGDTTSLQGDIANAATLVFDQTSAGTYAGVVSGAGTLRKTGAGTLTLTGASTLTGVTGVEGGTLALGANDALSAAGGLELGAGTTLALGGVYSTRVATLDYDDALLDFGAPGSANAFLFDTAGTGTGTGTLTVTNWESGSDVLAFAAGNTPAADFYENIYFSGIGSGSLGATGVSVSGYAGTWDTIVATAATFSTWDGGGANNNFGTAANWVGDVAPVSAADTKIAFAGSTRTGPTLGADFTLNSLKFDATADSFTVTANPGREFTFTGVVPSLIQASAADQAVTVPLVLTKNTFVEIAGDGDLALSGVVSGAGGFTVLGSGLGEVVLSGANTYTGATTINTGTVVLRHAAALGSTAVGTTVASGATLRLENNIAVGAEALVLNGTLRQASGTNAYSGPISGIGDVVIDGGQLTLSGSSANTYSGPTIVNAGTVVLGKTTGTTAIAGNLTIGDGAGLDTVRLAAADQIADGTRVTLSAGGTPTFDLAGHAETIGSLASTNAAAAVTLGSATLATGADGTSTAFAGVVSGTGGLTKQGAGNFTLSGANTHSGLTTVSAGTLVVQNSAALGATTGSTTVAVGATLQLENNVSVGAEALALSGTLRQASGTNTYGGAISGSGALVIDGGELTLSGTAANTRTGATTINTGTLVLNKTAGLAALAGDVVVGDGAGLDTLRLAAANQIADTARVTLSAGGTPTFDLAGHAETIGSLASANAAATVTLGSATLATGADGTSTTFAGVVSGSGGLTKQGAGTLTLTGANTYTGTTTLAGGTLALGASNRLADGSSLAFAGGTLALGGTASERVGEISFTDGVLDFGVTGTANHLLFDSAAASTGTLVVRNWTNGSDVLGSVADTLDATFLDSIFFDGLGVGLGAEIGALVTVAGYGDFYALRPIQTFVWSGENDNGPSPRNIWSDGDNWEEGNAPGLSADKAIVMAGTNYLAHDLNNDYTIRSLLYRDDAGAFVTSSAGGSILTINGGGVFNDSLYTQTLDVSVTVGVSHTWNASAADLRFDGADVFLGTRAVTVTGGNDVTVGAVVSGTGSTAFVKNGDGTLTLAATNTFTGAVTVNAGTVLVTADAALGTAAGGTTVGAAGTLAISGGINYSTTEAVSLAGALENVSGDNVFAAAITLAGDATITSTAGSLSLTGTLAAGGHALTVNGAGDLVVSSTLGGAADLTKSGEGTLTFSADQTFSGEITLSGGTLALEDASITAATLRITADSIIDFGGDSTLTVDLLVVDLADGEFLTITSWSEFTDYFVAADFTAGVYDTKGESPMNRILFADFSASDTRWHSSDNQVNPVPEPAAYGMLALGGLLAAVALRRRRRAPAG